MKPILLLILLTGFAFANPSTRHHVEPYLQVLLDPLYRWQTEGRLDEISRTLEAEVASGRRVPTTSDALVALLEQPTVGRPGSRDAWGRPFFVRRQGVSVRVGSAGPDREVGSADDILSRPVVALPR